MGYVYLLLTILSETVAVIFMKLSKGFENKINAGIAILTYVAGFVFLTLALKTLPAGLANAVWAGASTVLVAIAGVYFLKEELSVIQIVSLILIIVGLIGLNLGGNRH
ncbi:MAG: multidrug efflux SMR transporter [Chitinophagaceae bacterium]|nr:multidrug efflux SMR transporter [Chitinophagaceae bacterium]